MTCFQKVLMGTYESNKLVGPNDSPYNLYILYVFPFYDHKTNHMHLSKILRNILN